MVLFDFGHDGPISALFWPKNNRKWWLGTIIWKTNHPVHFKLGVYTHLVSRRKWFYFGTTLAQFWPPGRPKAKAKTEKCGFRSSTRKLIFSDNPHQTWCVRLFGESSEIIRFSATLAYFQSSGSHLCILIPSGEASGGACILWYFISVGLIYIHTLFYNYLPLSD